LQGGVILYKTPINLELNYEQLAQYQSFLIRDHDNDFKQLELQKRHDTICALHGYTKPFYSFDRDYTFDSGSIDLPVEIKCIEDTNLGYYKNSILKIVKFLKESNNTVKCVDLYIYRARDFYRILRNKFPSMYFTYNDLLKKSKQQKVVDEDDSSSDIKTIYSPSWNLDKIQKRINKISDFESNITLENIPEDVFFKNEDNLSIKDNGVKKYTGKMSSIFPFHKEVDFSDKGEEWSVDHKAVYTVEDLKKSLAYPISKGRNSNREELYNLNGVCPDLTGVLDDLTSHDTIMGRDFLKKFKDTIKNPTLGVTQRKLESSSYNKDFIVNILFMLSVLRELRNSTHVDKSNNSATYKVCKTLIHNVYIVIKINKYNPNPGSFIEFYFLYDDGNHQVSCKTFQQNSFCCSGLKTMKHSTMHQMFDNINKVYTLYLRYNNLNRAMLLLWIAINPYSDCATLCDHYNHILKLNSAIDSDGIKMSNLTSFFNKKMGQIPIRHSFAFLLFKKIVSTLRHNVTFTMGENCTYPSTVWNFVPLWSAIPISRMNFREYINNGYIMKFSYKSLQDYRKTLPELMETPLLYDHKYKSDDYLYDNNDDLFSSKAMNIGPNIIREMVDLLKTDKGCEPLINMDMLSECIKNTLNTKLISIGKNNASFFTESNSEGEYKTFPMRFCILELIQVKGLDINITLKEFLESHCLEKQDVTIILFNKGQIGPDREIYICDIISRLRTFVIENSFKDFILYYNRNSDYKSEYISSRNKDIDISRTMSEFVNNNKKLLKEDDKVLCAFNMDATKWSCAWINEMNSFILDLLGLDAEMHKYLKYVFQMYLDKEVNYSSDMARPLFSDRKPVFPGTSFTLESNFIMGNMNYLSSYVHDLYLHAARIYLRNKFGCVSTSFCHSDDSLLLLIIDKEQVLPAYNIVFTIGKCFNITHSPTKCMVSMIPEFIQKFYSSGLFDPFYNVINGVSMPFYTESSVGDVSDIGNKCFNLLRDGVDLHLVNSFYLTLRKSYNDYTYNHSVLPEYTDPSMYGMMSGMDIWNFENPDTEYNSVLSMVNGKSSYRRVHITDSNMVNVYNKLVVERDLESLDTDNPVICDLLHNRLSTKSKPGKQDLKACMMHKYKQELIDAQLRSLDMPVGISTIVGNYLFSSYVIEESITLHNIDVIDNSYAVDSFIKTYIPEEYIYKKDLVGTIQKYSSYVSANMEPIHDSFEENSSYIPNKGTVAFKHHGNVNSNVDIVSLIGIHPTEVQKELDLLYIDNKEVYKQVCNSVTKNYTKSVLNGNFKNIGSSIGYNSNIGWMFSSSISRTIETDVCYDVLLRNLALITVRLSEFTDCDMSKFLDKVIPLDGHVASVRSHIVSLKNTTKFPYRKELLDIVKETTSVSNQYTAENFSIVKRIANISLVRVDIKLPDGTICHALVQERKAKHFKLLGIIGSESSQGDTRNIINFLKDAYKNPTRGYKPCIYRQFWPDELWMQSELTKYVRKFKLLSKFPVLWDDWTLQKSKYSKKTIIFCLSRPKNVRVSNYSINIETPFYMDCLELQDDYASVAYNYLQRVFDGTECFIPRKLTRMKSINDFNTALVYIGRTNFSDLYREDLRKLIREDSLFLHYCVHLSSFTKKIPQILRHIRNIVSPKDLYLILKALDALPYLGMELSRNDTISHHIGRQSDISDLFD
jgi:hypothetical protein